LTTFTTLPLHTQKRLRFSLSLSCRYTVTKNIISSLNFYFLKDFNYMCVIFFFWILKIYRNPFVFISNITTRFCKIIVYVMIWSINIKSISFSWRFLFFSCRAQVKQNIFFLPKAFFSLFLLSWRCIKKHTIWGNVHLFLVQLSFWNVS